MRSQDQWGRAPADIQNMKPFWESVLTVELVGEKVNDGNVNLPTSAASFASGGGSGSSLRGALESRSSLRGLDKFDSLGLYNLIM